LDWDELTPEQQAAAKVLKYTKEKWVKYTKEKWDTCKED
jgi:hypothetical protein